MDAIIVTTYRDTDGQIIGRRSIVKTDIIDVAGNTITTRDAVFPADTRQIEFSGETFTAVSVLTDPDSDLHRMALNVNRHYDAVAIVRHMHRYLSDFDPNDLENRSPDTTSIFNWLSRIRDLYR